jgi:hypothetical protein
MKNVSIVAFLLLVVAVLVATRFRSSNNVSDESSMENKRQVATDLYDDSLLVSSSI